jgi:hypothetical protein
MLKTIFSISGKPGLFKKVTQGQHLMIVESLTDQKRIPAYARDKVVSLGDISIYTNDEDVPLYKVLNNIREKENLQPVPMDTAKATPDELRNYFAEILPDFDREKVYPTDIKRLINWYNLLLSVGITSFDPEAEEGEIADETAEHEADEENKKMKDAKPRQTAAQKKTAAPKKSVSHSKQQPPAAGKMRQRTKQK